MNANVTTPEVIQPNEETTTAEEKIFYATQWQLMWLKFKKHRVAMAAGIIIIFMYLVAIFAPFVAPYDPDTRHRNAALVPPTRLDLLMRMVSLSAHLFTQLSKK